MYILNAGHVFYLFVCLFIYFVHTEHGIGHVCIHIDPKQICEYALTHTHIHTHTHTYTQIIKKLASIHTHAHTHVQTINNLANSLDFVLQLRRVQVY